MAGLPAACTGGATGPVTATSRLDVDPARPRAPVLVDVAPDAAAVVAGAAPAAADGRLAGPGRIQTAIEISRTAFPDSARSVYLARADVLVDAVASGSLTDGPVLLVPTCGAVPADVEAEIARLDPDEVVAVGGTEAVCDAALAEAAAGRSAGRVAGPDRVATAAAVATRAFPVGASEVYLAGAGALADAVPAGTLTQGPLLLVPSCGELPDVVAAALRRLVPERVVVLGGADVVCEELVEAAAGAEPALRLAGPGRLATAVAIARRAFPGGAPTVYVARADDAADAVAGGSLRDGPILLVPRCGDVPAEILAAVRQLRPDRVVALGGTAAVCDAALAELVGAG